MQNNLFLLSPVCHGVQIVYHIDMSGNAPFNLLVASKNEIEAGFIADTFFPFYRHLVEEGNIVASFDKFLSEKMIMVHSDKVFLVGMARYFRNKYFGKGGQERRERLLTEVLKNKPNNRYARRVFRSRIKTFVKPHPEIFFRYASTFLCGKNPNFTFRDVLELARVP